MCVVNFHPFYIQVENLYNNLNMKVFSYKEEK